MIVFKLSFSNMKKSIKDYSIYFLTLVLGVAIFYMFNSIESGQAMLQISRVTKRDNKIDGFNAWICISICFSCTGTTNCLCEQLFN